MEKTGKNEPSMGSSPMNRRKSGNGRRIASVDADAQARDEVPHVRTSFPVVGIGASSGGLDAFRQLLKAMPATTGMAFVIIQHLDPKQPSLLASALATATKMTVVEACDGMHVEPNRVHVIPSNAEMTIVQGSLCLFARGEPGTGFQPIDSFFVSLAAERGPLALGVVLSGMGSDGAAGIAAIKAEGGITFAQTPSSAQSPSMPERAIATGAVDHQLAPDAIAQELARLSRSPHLKAAERARTVASDDAESVRALLEAVRGASDVDFAGYKRVVILRRIARRMTLGRVASMKEYADLVRRDPAEAEALARDMLVHVTSFFRDGGSYDILKERVFPDILKRKLSGDVVRIWVPGCSTGEEVYSTAICLLETLGPSSGIEVQIFGTDVDDKAISSARSGKFAAASTRELHEERLTRFFVKTESGHAVRQHVRDVCVFAKHDLTRDPPFARLDLVSCRNVLIYLDRQLQQRALAMFHYCLNGGGYLVLGNSEAIVDSSLFRTVSRQPNVFQKPEEPSASRPPSAIATPHWPARAVATPDGRSEAADDFRRHADHLLLARYAPPCVIVNEKLDVLQTRGRAEPFLQPLTGSPDKSPVRAIREALCHDLRLAIAEAEVHEIGARRQGLTLSDGEGSIGFDLEVLPLAAASAAEKGTYLVLFDVATASPSQPEPTSSRPEACEEGADAKLARLTVELASTRAYLLSLIDEHTSVHAELAATHRKVVTSNEELLVANEELEAAREELQASNEELTTFNEELRHGNKELDELASDLVNVLECASIPIVIVNRETLIRRFTPNARHIANLIPADVGRPLDDIRVNIRFSSPEEPPEVRSLANQSLAMRIAEVMNDGHAREWEVQDGEDHWYRLQIRVYRGRDGATDGAVLSLVDIHALKQAKVDAEHARDCARAIVETVQVPLVVLDDAFRVVSANRSFLDAFAVESPLPSLAPFFEIENGQWDIAELRDALSRLVETGKTCEGVEASVDIAHVGARVVFATARLIDGRSNGQPSFLLAIQDITEERASGAKREAFPLDCEG